MHIEFKKMLLELVPDDHLNENVKKLANVAGVLASLIAKDGSTYLSIRYCDMYTEFFRTRNAGRSRKSEAMAWGEVCALRKEKGAKETAAALNMSLLHLLPALRGK